MSLRIEKINSQIMRLLMEIIREEVDDPSLGMLSITRVETSADLHESRVYFSVLDEKQMPHAKESLDKMSGFLRMHLGHRLTIKFLPELKFFADDSLRYSVYIYDKIEEARANDSDKASNGGNKEDNSGDTEE